jgi:hypothetical protein
MLPHEVRAKRWPDLLDCAGNRIPVDKCRCGLPKLASAGFCCDSCPSFTGRVGELHTGMCRLRCGVLGVPGFCVTQSRFAGYAIRLQKEPLDVPPRTPQGSWEYLKERLRRRGLEQNRRGEQCVPPSYCNVTKRRVWREGYNSEARP